MSRRLSSKTAYAESTWFEYLTKNCQASTGWGGNLTGMKKLYWGDCYAIKCCNCWFKVSYEVFTRVVFD